MSGSIGCSTLYQSCPLIDQGSWWHVMQTAQELQQLFKLLDAYGCAEWIQFDASIMRGLAYYTG